LFSGELSKRQKMRQCAIQFTIHPKWRAKAKRHALVKRGIYMQPIRFSIALGAALVVTLFAPIASFAQKAPAYEGMTISTAGFGDLRVGMSIEDAQKTLGEPLKKLTSVPEAACFYTPASNERLVLRFKAAKLVSVDTSSATAGVTRSGIRVGESADKVRAVYSKEPSYKELKSPFDQRPVTVVGSGANQVALALSDGKVDLIRVGLAADLWGRCEP
jgi:hypothetical protein